MLFIKSLKKESCERPPMWLMRQAGRYLPEYRELRSKAGSFLDLCYNPKMAKEVTLQPIRRFGFDAAILFSDILVIPDALGVKVEFLAGEGPHLQKLSVLESEEKLTLEIEALEKAVPHISNKLKNVWETVKLTRNELDADKALIGFCGAPWTVGLYMLDEKPSKSSEVARTLAYKYPHLFERLMNVLVESSTHYLIGQIENGADALQIFDSWAASVPDSLYEEAVEKPLLQICENVKKKHPEVPIILFPRGLDETKLLKLTEKAKGRFEGLSLDYTVNLKWAVQNLQDKVCIQGNLDPVVMLSTPKKIKEETEKVLKIATQKPGYIFNFGHGILPTVPVEHVEVLAKTVQNWRNK